MKSLAAASVVAALARGNNASAVSRATRMSGSLKRFRAAQRGAEIFKGTAVESPSLRVEDPIATVQRWVMLLA
jgi:hypothetical protein